MCTSLCYTCNRNIILQYGKILFAMRPRFCGSDSENIQIPPEPTTCCMSGCDNCVWIAYAEELTRLLDGNTEKARQIVLDKISDPNLKMFLSMELHNLNLKK